MTMNAGNRMNVPFQPKITSSKYHVLSSVVHKHRYGSRAQGLTTVSMSAAGNTGAFKTSDLLASSQNMQQRIKSKVKMSATLTKPSEETEQKVFEQSDEPDYVLMQFDEEGKARLGNSLGHTKHYRPYKLKKLEDPSELHQFIKEHVLSRVDKLEG